MSRALQRLRRMFGDPLLVRGTGTRMTRTARANELYQPLQDILLDVGRMIMAPTVEPSEMRGEVIIASRDYEMAALMPRMISRVSQMAPELVLNLRPMVGDDLSPLEENRVDFVVAGTDRTVSTLKPARPTGRDFRLRACSGPSLGRQEAQLDGLLGPKALCRLVHGQFQSRICGPLSSRARAKTQHPSAGSVFLSCGTNSGQLRSGRDPTAPARVCTWPLSKATWSPR